MSLNISSDSSNPEDLKNEIVSTLLDYLDKARNLEDLVQSLKVQKCVITALLVLLE